MSGSRSPVLWAGLAVLVVGMGVGTVAGVVSSGKTSEVEKLCRDGKCPPPAHGVLAAVERTEALHAVVGRVAAERDALRQQLADLQGIPVEDVVITSTSHDE